MGGPNRKLRRAMEAQARKASRNIPAMPAEAIQEINTYRNMYDQKVMQVASMNAELQKFRAIAAGLLVEADMDEVTLSPGTLQVLQSGIVTDVERRINEDSSITVRLVFDGGEDDDGSEEEE